MEDKLLTRENKTQLVKILYSKRAEELNIQNIQEQIMDMYSKAICNYIRKFFKDHIEILDRYKNVRDQYKISGPGLSTTSRELLESLVNYPEIDNNISENNLYESLEDSDFIGDVSEISERYLLIKTIPNMTIRLNYPKELPPLSVLGNLADSFGMDVDTINRIMKEPLSILSTNELIDLQNTAAKLVHKCFIRDNYLRIFKYPKEGSSVYEYREFLWNIKTWRQLKELNEEWYEILVNNSEIESKPKGDQLLSGKSIEDVLSNLDNDLGL